MLIDLGGGGGGGGGFTKMNICELGNAFWKVHG